tara:strand:+ start:1634 stop:2089 length:456 start_codon:yes stop_codon:yes gene_type:complete
MMDARTFEKIRARRAAEWHSPGGRNPYEPMTLDGLAAIKREYNDKTWKPGENVASDALTEAELWKYLDAPLLALLRNTNLRRTSHPNGTSWCNWMLVGPGRKPGTVRVRRRRSRKGVPVQGAEPLATIVVDGLGLYMLGWTPVSHYLEKNR